MVRVISPVDKSFIDADRSRAVELFGSKLWCKHRYRLVWHAQIGEMFLGVAMLLAAGELAALV